MKPAFIQPFTNFIDGELVTRTVKDAELPGVIEAGVILDNAAGSGEKAFVSRKYEDWIQSIGCGNSTDRAIGTGIALPLKTFHGTKTFCVPRPSSKYSIHSYLPLELPAVTRKFGDG